MFFFDTFPPKTGIPHLPKISITKPRYAIALSGTLASFFFRVLLGHDRRGKIGPFSKGKSNFCERFLVHLQKIDPQKLKIKWGKDVFQANRSFSF